MDLLAELGERIVCGDGAIGTLLLDHGELVDRCLEEFCVSAPDRIRAVHEEYVAAGARVIETNTFGANAVRLARFGLEDRVQEINKAAVRLAKKAIRGKDIYVAGSVGPLGISALEAEKRGIDQAHCFREQIAALLDANVDLIFFETFLSFEEIEIALGAASASDCLIVSLFACEPDGRLQSGMPLMNAFTRCHDMGGENCRRKLFKRTTRDGAIVRKTTSGELAGGISECRLPALHRMSLRLSNSAR